MGCVPSKSAEKSQKRKMGGPAPLPKQQLEPKPIPTAPISTDKTQSPVSGFSVLGTTVGRSDIFAESLARLPPISLEGVESGETVDIPIKMWYTTGTRRVEANFDHLCAGERGKLRLSGIDEDGAFYRLRARFQLDGRVYMEKKLVGMDDDEDKTVYHGRAEGKVIVGALDRNNGAAKGNFEIAIQGELWRNEDGCCSVALALDQEKRTVSGIGHDTHGFGVWKGTKTGNVFDVVIQHADGSEGRFVGAIVYRMLAGKLQNDLEKRDVIFSRASP